MPITEEFDTGFISESVVEPEVNMTDLAPDVQSLQQKIMANLTSEQG